MGKMEEMEEPPSFLTVVMRRGRELGVNVRSEGELNNEEVGSTGRLAVPHVGRIASAKSALAGWL